MQLIAFGKENMNEMISDAICKKILFKGFEAVPSLIDYVHFNKSYPQNHNCFISNVRGKYATIYDGSEWILKNMEDVLDVLKDNGRDFLENKFDEFYDSLCEDTKRKFGRYISEADTDVVKARYRESLILLLYNKKGIVLKTKKKIVQENGNNKLLKNN